MNGRKISADWTSIATWLLFLCFKKQTCSASKTVEEAQAFKIQIVRGDVTNDYLPAQGFNNLTNVSEPSRQLKMLKSGRVDLFPFNAQSV